MKYLRLVLVSMAICALAGCEKRQVESAGNSLETDSFRFSVTVENSGWKAVDQLVSQLVSQRPAPFPSGYANAPDDLTLGRYITPEVESAMQELQAMGNDAFPVLVDHIRDDRYCYSGVVAGWNNYTVGDAVVLILCDGHSSHSGYKWRDTPSGGVPYLSFEDYLNARGSGPWSELAKSQPRLHIQTEFLGWCIAQEKERGFIDEDQRRKVLDVYSAAGRRLYKQYTEQSE